MRELPSDHRRITGILQGGQGVCLADPVSAGRLSEPNLLHVPLCATQCRKSILWHIHWSAHGRDMQNSSAFDHRDQAAPGAKSAIWRFIPSRRTSMSAEHNVPKTSARRDRLGFAPAIRIGRRVMWLRSDVVA